MASKVVPTAVLKLGVTPKSRIPGNKREGPAAPKAPPTIPDTIPKINKAMILKSISTLEKAEQKTLQKP